MSAPCWSCNLVGEDQGALHRAPPFGLPSLCHDMVEGVSDSGWHATLTRGLNEAWQTRLFTDLVIRTQDQVIHAHKIILAAASPYFRAMLSAGLVEGQTQTLVLEDVSGNVLNTVLTFVYTGRASLTEHNVQEVLTLADYFQIHSLKKLCCYYLKTHLVSRTCLSVYEVAALHRCNDLAAEALALAASQCSEVLAQPDFLSLQPETLITLLKQPYLSVETEETIFKGVVDWVSKNPAERQKWLPVLIENIDLEFLKSNRNKWLAVLKEKQLLEDLKNVIDPAVVECNGDDEDCENQYLQKTIRHSTTEEVLLVMGGESNGRLLRNTECFAVGYSSWRCSIPEVARRPNSHYHQLQVLPPMQHARAYCAVATQQNMVYVLGGQTTKTFLASCECYNVLSNSWHHLNDLPEAMHGSGAAFLDGSLYLAGGKSQERYHSGLWVYNEYKDTWSNRGSMGLGRAHFGLAALHGSLYAVGGVGWAKGGSQILDSCEKYDPGADVWVPIASLGQARAYLGVAVIHDHLYAIGGYNGSQWLNCVERYDPLRDQWTSVSPMISARSSFGVTVSHGRIYCLGGFSGESNLNSVEKYNPRTNMWHCVQSMQLRRYGLVAATVSVPGALR
uniref:Kelch-like protein diablo n=3 Tax=Scylla olivacea TaxID=85551 RepID=A0A0P4W6R1_SCYOL